MPRVSVCLNRHDPKKSFENESIDICKKCWRDVSVEDLREEIGDDSITDEELESDLNDAQMGGGCDHPCYSDCDYDCAICSKPLTEEDN